MLIGIAGLVLTYICFCSVTHIMPRSAGALACAIRDSTLLSAKSTDASVGLGDLFSRRRGFQKRVKKNIKKAANKVDIEG